MEINYLQIDRLYTSWLLSINYNDCLKTYKLPYAYIQVV